jgi:hypothetical protein
LKLSVQLYRNRNLNERFLVVSVNPVFVDKIFYYQANAQRFASVLVQIGRGDFKRTPFIQLDRSSRLTGLDRPAQSYPYKPGAGLEGCTSSKTDKQKTAQNLNAPDRSLVQTIFLALLLFLP